MNIKPLTFTAVFILFFHSSPAQQIANRLKTFNQEEYLAYVGKTSETTNLKHFDIDRSMRQQFTIMADSPGIVVVNDELRVKHTPAVLWGLGAAGGYYLSNLVLFGSTDNVSGTGLLASIFGAILVGTIVNQSKKARHRQKLDERDMESK